jgi:hypothetical protein
MTPTSKDLRGLAQQRILYLNMLRTSNVSVIHQLYGNEPFYYHREVRNYLDETLLYQWIGREGSDEYIPHAHLI